MQPFYIGKTISTPCTYFDISNTRSAGRRGVVCGEDLHGIQYWPITSAATYVPIKYPLYHFLGRTGVSLE